MTNEELKKQFEAQWWHEVEGVEEPSLENRDRLWTYITTALDEAREEGVREFVDWFASKNLMIIEGEWVENGDILDEYLASKKEQKHDE